jgi:hypothetical protein
MLLELALPEMPEMPQQNCNLDRQGFLGKTTITDLFLCLAFNKLKL